MVLQILYPVGNAPIRMVYKQAVEYSVSDKTHPYAKEWIIWNQKLYPESSGLLCYAIMFVCSPLIARFFDMPILNGIVKVYSVTLFINSLTSVQYAKLNHELTFQLQARISFVSALVTGILGVVLAYLGWGVWLLFKRQPICHLAEFEHYRDYSEGYLPFAGKNPGRRVFGLQCPISVEVWVVIESKYDNVWKHI